MFNLPLERRIYVNSNECVVFTSYRVGDDIWVPLFCIDSMIGIKVDLMRGAHY